MSLATIIDLVLVLSSAVLAYLVSFGHYRGRTRLTYALSIVATLGLLAADRVLWVNTGRGLVESATCLALPNVKPCGAAPDPRAKPKPETSPSLPRVVASRRVPPMLEVAQPAPPARDVGPALALLPYSRTADNLSLEDTGKKARANPRDPDAWSWYGLALAERDDWQGALAAYKKARALPPKDIGRGYLDRDLAEAYERTGDVAHGLEAAKRMVHEWPVNQQGMYCRSAETEVLLRLYLKAQDTDGALAFWDALTAEAKAPCVELGEALEKLRAPHI